MNSNAKRISIVASTFNEFLVDSMIESSIKTLKEHGYDEALIDINRVPGAFEVPLMAKKIALSGDYKAIVALGVIVRGATPHFDFISKTSTEAIMKLSIENKKPIGNGIITCLNIRQAIARKKKGREAALAVTSVLSQL